MDVDGDRNALENERREIEAYLSHPLTREIVTDNEEQQQALINLLCNHSIVNIETFFGHFEAIGHLRGLRRGRAIIKDKMEEIDIELEKLKK